MSLPRTVAMIVSAALVVALAAPLVHAQNRRSSQRSATRSKRGARVAPSWPSYDVRHGEWVRRKELALGSGVADPDPLSQYLVSEVLVTGVFETEDGMGVFMLATPTGNTFFARPGAQLYNGRLVEVRPGKTGFADAVEAVFAERAKVGGEERPVVKRVEAVPAPAPATP